MSSAERLESTPFKRQLNRAFAWYTGGFLTFVLILSVMEVLGVGRQVIGLSFLAGSVLLYAGIGFVSRTSDPVEYYVAGRRVPAVYNGMATGADWMSAASFMGLAGTLYVSGYGGLAYILGWTGGFCLVAMLLAPYLRKFGQYTIPDFLGARYEGNLPRLLGVVAALLCSFTYVVAQIYGVGLVASSLTGMVFEIGVFAGLAGILVCSFLGGMRAVTWTQVAQYIVLVIAYMVPVVWLSVKQTGMPVPQIAYAQQLEKVTQIEQRLVHDPAELSVRAVYQERAALLERKLSDVPLARAQDREAAQAQLNQLIESRASRMDVHLAERALSKLPANDTLAREAWTKALAEARERSQPLAGMPPHALPFKGDPHGTPKQQQEFDDDRRNFLALVFCLTVGTAALPHILMRSYTTPTVRQARESVAWSLLFIVVLYISAPALAVMVKYEVFTQLVGLPFDHLPDWMARWSRIDPNLLSVVDVNGDHILQFGELKIGTDIFVLLAPELGGMPFVVSGMVAAGGLAAALSTADGLLLTISNALSHDVYYQMINPRANTSRRVALSKMLLLVVALAAAYVAAQRPGDILFMVAAAFSLAGSALFPALVLGVFWPRANKWGACAGIAVGLGVATYYMAINQPWLRELLAVSTPVRLWWGIQPVSAAVFGVPLGALTIVVVSLLTRPPRSDSQALVASLRYPDLNLGKP